METPVSSEASAPAPFAKNKKLFIAALAVLGVVIVFILITILTGGSDEPQSTITDPNQQPTDNSGRQNSDSTNNPQAVSPKDLEKIYQDSLYKINYPSDWTAEAFNVSEASWGVYIKPQAFVKGPMTDSFIITVDSRESVPSISQKQQSFVSLGFKSDFIPLDGLSATRLRGTFPPVRTATQSAAVKLMQETHIFVDKGENSYLLVYKYAGSAQNPKLERMFAQMVSSFKFIQ